MTTNADILAALAAATRPITPADIREHFGPDVDAAALMGKVTVLD